MASTIESVDNLPRPPEHARVNPTDRSSPDKKGRQFKRALEEEMEREQDRHRHESHDDSVLLSSEKNPDGRDEEKSQTTPPDTDGSATDGEPDDGSEHIDLKA